MKRKALLLALCVMLVTSPAWANYLGDLLKAGIDAYSNNITVLNPKNLKVGNGTPTVTLNGEDMYVEGTFEVDGAARFDGAVTMASGPTMTALTASKPVFTDASKLLTSAGTMPVNQGGTNLTSYAVGDILYASAATTIGKLADVAAGQPLLSGGLTTAPAYAGYTFAGTAAATYTFPTATKTLAANDGSNLTISGQAIGDLPIASSATAYGKLADVATGQVLVSGGVGAAPAYSATPMVTSVTLSGATASKPLFTDGSKVTTSTGTVPTDQGGTGLASYAVGDLLYASEATTLAKLADVAVNQVLVSGGVGAAPAYSAAPVTATHALTTPRGTSGSGIGVTVNDAGSLRTQVYKVSVAKDNFLSAGVTHDLVIWTAPAKSIIHSVLANVSEAFVCGAVCTTSTLSATLGVAAGGVEYLESFDLDAATGWFGDADAEVGSALDIAANTNGGYILPAGGAFTLRATSGTGNWGDTATTNLSAGALEFYILYSVLP